MWFVPCLLPDPSYRSKERDPLAASSSRLCLLPAWTPRRNSPPFPRLSRAPSPPRDSLLNRPSRCRALHDRRNRHTLPTGLLSFAAAPATLLSIFLYHFYERQSICDDFHLNWIWFRKNKRKRAGAGRGARLSRHCCLRSAHSRAVFHTQPSHSLSHWCAQRPRTSPSRSLSRSHSLSLENSLVARKGGAGTYHVPWRGHKTSLVKKTVRPSVCQLSFTFLSFSARFHFSPFLFGFTMLAHSSHSTLNIAFTDWLRKVLVPNYRVSCLGVCA